MDGFSSTTSGWLITWNVFSHSSRRPEKPQTKMSWSYFLRKALRVPLLPLLASSGCTGIPWIVDVSPISTSISTWAPLILSPCVWFLSPYCKPVIELGLTFIPYVLVLMILHLQRSYFKWVPSHRYQRVKDFNIHLGDTIQPMTQSSILTEEKIWPRLY